ncbi:MAG: protein-L-isoaspartate(D-aspartate) O-methyltransferase [Breznakibacter sp.]
MRLLIIALFMVSLAQDYANQRQHMVTEQLERRGIESSAVLNAMRQVPRHEFVPAESRHLAYNDSPLPIGYNQTISQPYIVAYMTEKLNVTKKQKVLEIGTGSGYQAAVLSLLADSVYTIEIVKPLGETARTKLKELGYNNVRVKIGDGYQGWRQHAPYDAIMVTAAPEKVPPPLIDQLKEGGVMVVPIGPEKGMQYLQYLEKRNGKMVKKKLLPVKFVPFTRDEKGNEQ